MLITLNISPPGGGSPLSPPPDLPAGYTPTLQNDDFTAFSSVHYRFENTGGRRLEDRPVHFGRFSTTQADTGRCSYLRNLDYFQAYTSPFWDGAKARIYTVDNGVMSLLANTTVTNAKLDCAAPILGQNTIATVTQAEWEFPSYVRTSVDYYFRVGAVDSGGIVGAMSAWVSYTAPASIDTSGTPTNTTSATTINGYSGGLSAPTGVAVAAGPNTSIPRVTWNSVASAIGYYVEVCYQDATDNADFDNGYIELADTNLSVPEGALVILEKEMLTVSTDISHRGWNVYELAKEFQAGGALNLFPNSDPDGALAGTAAEFRAYTGGDPAPTHLGVDLGHYVHSPKTSGNITASAFHATTDLSAYFQLQPGVTYRVTFVARATQAGTFTSSFSHGNINALSSLTHNVTTSWQRFNVDFQITTEWATGNTVGWHYGDWSGPGNIQFAEFYITDTRVDYRDLYSVTALNGYSTSPGSYMRCQHLGSQPTRQTGRARTILSQGVAFNGNVGVPSLLWRAKTHNLIPWLALDPMISEEDYVAIVNYLAAPSSYDHWAVDLRVAQGQTAPWIDEFDEIILEFGNEVWNTAFFKDFPSGVKDQTTSEVFGQANAKLYGIASQYFINAMKTSPYYNAMKAKTLFYLGGWAINSWGAQAVSYCPDADASGAAWYYGPWSNSDPEATYRGEFGVTFYENVLGTVPNTFEAWATSRQTEFEAQGVSKVLHYEGGPDYGSSATSAQSELRECINKSRASATAMADGYLLYGALGAQTSNFYETQIGSFWSAASREMESDDIFFPYGILKQIHDAVGGKARIIKMPTVQNPTRADGADAIAVYGLQSWADPSRWAIVAVNRNIDVSLLETDDPMYSATPSGTEAITINTPIASCTGSQYWANVGNFREHNRWKPGFRFENDVLVADPLCVAADWSWTNSGAITDASQIVIDTTFGAAAGGLPAGNAVVIQLTGCVMQPDAAVTRPYGANAAWNVPVASLTHATNEATRVNELYIQSSPVNWNLRQDTFTYPVYHASDATGTYEVQTSFGNAVGTSIPFNPSWQAAPGDDGQIIILDTDTGEEWNIFQYTGLNGSNQITGTRCNKVQGDDQGVGTGDANYFTREVGYAPSRGAGIQYLAMLVRRWEIEQGLIEHALSMPSVNTAHSGGYGYTTAGFVAPATKAENFGTDDPARVIVEGTRFSLEVSDAEITSHLASLPADVSTTMKDHIRTILVAMRDYGWFITDTSGANGLQLECDVSANWSEIGFADFVSGVNGKTYPRDALDGIVTEARLRCYVPSDQY